MAPASRTRPPTSGSRDGDGEASEEGFESLAPAEDALLEALAPAPPPLEAPKPPSERVPPPGHGGSNPSEWPFPVMQLVHEARATEDEAQRRDVARRLNLLLDEMAKEGGSRQVADVFHGLLDGGALEGLVDPSGRTSHSAAVEGLLSLGFPFALEVRPEDLDGLNEGPEAGTKKDWRVELPSLLVVLTGVLGQFLWDMLGQGPAERYPPALLALMIFALVAVMVGSSRSALRRLGVVMLAVVSGLTVLASLVPGYAGLAAGLAGLVAAFLAARQES